MIVYKRFADRGYNCNDIGYNSRWHCNPYHCERPGMGPSKYIGVSA